MPTATHAKFFGGTDVPEISTHVAPELLQAYVGANGSFSVSSLGLSAWNNRAEHDGSQGKAAKEFRF